MPASKSNFLDKVLGRIGQLDREGLQTVVQRLARERKFLETLFNTIEDGVLVVDPDGKLLYLNHAATRLVGVQDSAEDQLIHDLLPEIDWEKISHFDTRGGEHVFRQEFDVQFPRPRFLRLYAAPLDGEASGSSGVALILHDATESRQQTFEAIESERVQALTLLAASVAHEIGNPLNALHIHLQLMERELRRLSMPARTVAAAKNSSRRRIRPAPEVPPEIQTHVDRLSEFLSVAKGEINRLDYIITQFLQAIRPVPPHLAPASLNEVVGKTLDLLRPELANRGLSIQTNLHRDLPQAPLDLAQMQQVLVNLIKNAMQAMTRGGELTLRTGEGMDGVWVSVEDTGGGISQEQISRVFEPFYTTKKKGSGLGLMIVRRIVRAHGGRIEIDSRIGHGTSIRVWLPLHERKPRLLEAPSVETLPR
ncbi:MAG: ATP-binding protein [Verrucomicrobia bacterium]|jgi:PAS domain S-box-containing protein|nr:ATP-binding protein [Verrucomicrobiota bacterium]